MALSYYKQRLKMISQEVENLITKYLTNEANSIDLDILSKWIVENQDNEKLFEIFVKTHYEVRLAMSKPDVESLKNNLLQKIKKDKSPFYKYKIQSVLKYAAIVAIVFGGTYLYQTVDFTNQVTVQEVILIPNEELITIQFDNGKVQTINLEENQQIVDANNNVIASQNKSQLNYTSATTIEKLVYNTLNVPYGKRFDLVLSDGTHVFLNSGTSLRYPIKFIAGEPRDVFLTGEAYFDVIKDEKHPFIVHADKMEVEVLGTKFNVAYYSEDESINTVLVEGAVALNHDKINSTSTPTLLTPGYKAEWDKLSSEISIEKVDTRIYTAWIEGKLIFRNTTFRQIRNTLTRHYNVTIKNNNHDLDAQLFDATFDIESINEIMETFSKSYAIDYEIVDNEIQIN